MPSGIPNKGIVIDQESPLDVSKVSLLDPVDKRPAKIEWYRVRDEDGKVRKARLSVRSGHEVPRPSPPVRLRFGKHQEITKLCTVYSKLMNNGSEGPRDTKPEDVVKRTFSPDLRMPPVPLDCHV